MNTCGMNNLKILFVLIVSIVFLFIKKLDAQTKLKLQTDCNMQTKNHLYEVIWLYTTRWYVIIYTPGDLLMNENRSTFFFSSWRYIFMKQDKLL